MTLRPRSRADLAHMVMEMARTAPTLDLISASQLLVETIEGAQARLKDQEVAMLIGIAASLIAQVPAEDLRAALNQRISNDD